MLLLLSTVFYYNFYADFIVALNDQHQQVPLGSLLKLIFVEKKKSQLVVNWPFR